MIDDIYEVCMSIILICITTVCVIGTVSICRAVYAGMNSPTISAEAE